jgi:hypothetical protein
MLTPNGPPSAISAWMVAAPPFNLSTRVPCMALVLAVIPTVTAPDEVEINRHVTSGSALSHVV